jgi:hypothetical protein
MKISNKLSRRLFIFCVLPVLACGCAVNRTEFSQVNSVCVTQKEPRFVEYYRIQPKRSALCLGYVKVDGNGYSNHYKVITEGKNQAGSIGGDYILLEDSGTDTSTVYHPGYSSYQENGSSYLNGNKNYISGSANQNANGFSIGPSVETVNCPWAVFSVWVYKPSQFGIDYDEALVVTGFHLNSDAKTRGVKIGDKIIGIDGYDVRDEGLPQHLMEIMPGDTVTVSVLRNGERNDLYITAMTN